MHSNECDGAVCKKAVTLSAAKCSNDELVIRLNRWLVAGVEDAGWPDGTARTYHLRVGGVGLIDLREGVSVGELDAIAAAQAAC